MAVVIWDAIQSYRGNRSQQWEYVYNRIKSYGGGDNVSNVGGSLDYRENIPHPILTPPPMEAIIDLKRMSAWDVYLLWQHNIEGLSTRQIAGLTGYGKSLVAQDLRYLHDTTV